MRIGIDYTAAIRQGGGIGRYTRELINALLSLESDHQYTLFAATGGIETQNLELGARFRSIPLSDEWLARIWHRARLPIPVELITGQLDILYSPDFVLPPALPRAKTILTVHDLSFIHYPDHFVPKLVHYLSQVVPRSVARADHVLADSQATKTDLVHHLGVTPDKISVLYSGVDPRFHPQAEPGEGEWLRARYELGEQPIILGVGTIQPRKNYLGLIRAFLNLQIEAQLVIAGGPGWLYEEVLAAAGKHSERIRVLGFVEDADLPALYRQATLFVFPSFYEGFGLPVLEAMACGIPVVCSNVSSVPEVAGQAALLVDPHDEAALTGAMQRALQDSALRQKMVCQGLEQAARFTWTKSAQQLLAAFQDL